MKYLTGAVSIALAALSFTPTQSAQAADLILVCNLTQTMANGQKRAFKRQIELTFPTRDVSFFDDMGQGFKFVNQYQYLRADANMIVLRQEATTESWIDRRTGAYLYRKTGDQTIQGTCEKARTAQRKF